MTLSDKLKARKAPEETVIIDGDSYLVVGLGRKDRGQLLKSSESLECRALAKCVRDPDTREPVMPDPKDWEDLDDGAAVGKLANACISVLGLDDSETKAMGKGSQEKASSS